MSGVRRFACTQCGKCCNRSPEVELSEAAALADVFVFRLMLRLYSLPPAPERGSNAELFYQKKRLLTAHAASAYSKKVMRDGRPVERMHYLMISALALNTRIGSCPALEAGRCNIYNRRPLGCRTVPFHYSRPDALAERDFDAFVSTQGHSCDVGEHAPLVLESGRIIDAATQQARTDALSLSQSDQRWKRAIVRRMKGKRGSDELLPSIDDVEACAGFSALTTSMRVAWEIAADEGLMGSVGLLVRTQLQTIEREISNGGCSGDELSTLAEMAVEYRQGLNA